MVDLDAPLAHELLEIPIGQPKTEVPAHRQQNQLRRWPEHRLVFDVNDFDETLPGHWEWDGKRLAASLTIASQHRVSEKSVGRFVTTGAVRTYRQAIAGYLGSGTVFGDSVAEFSFAHAKQNQRDYDEFKGQIDDEQLAADTEN